MRVITNINLSNKDKIDFKFRTSNRCPSTIATTSKPAAGSATEALANAVCKDGPVR